MLNWLINQIDHCRDCIYVHCGKASLLDTKGWFNLLLLVLLHPTPTPFFLFLFFLKNQISGIVQSSPVKHWFVLSCLKRQFLLEQHDRRVVSWRSHMWLIVKVKSCLYSANRCRSLCCISARIPRSNINWGWRWTKLFSEECKQQKTKHPFIRFFSFYYKSFSSGIHSGKKIFHPIDSFFVTMIIFCCCCWTFWNRTKK